MFFLLKQSTEKVHNNNVIYKIDNKTDTIFINSENSKISNSHFSIFQIK